LEIAYELDPYGPAGSDEALAAIVTAILNSDERRKEPLKFEDVCPQLKHARRKKPVDDAKGLHAAAQAIANAFR
jgi:hypothetical protein